MNCLPENIKRVRKKMNLSQVEFADKLMVTQALVSNWEAVDPKKNKVPSLDVLMKLCKLANVTVEWLYYNTSDNVDVLK